MDIIFDCLDEIALEGLDGITLNSLWIRLKVRQPELNIDENFKNYIWSSIILKCNELNFFELTKPRPGLIIDFDSKQDNIDQIYPIEIVDDNVNVVRGSCSTYYSRKDVTKIIKQDSLSVTQVTERWGESMCIVGSQKRREIALLGETRQAVFTNKYINTLFFCILEYIGRSRFVGVTSMQICKIFKITQSNCFSIFNKIKDVVTIYKYGNNQYNLVRFPSKNISAVCYKKFVEILLESGNDGVNKEELLVQTQQSLKLKKKRIRSLFDKFSKEFLIERQTIKKDGNDKPLELEIVKLDFSPSITPTESISANICKDRYLMTLEDSMARNLKNYITIKSDDEGRSSQEVSLLMSLNRLGSFNNDFKKYSNFNMHIFNNKGKLENRIYWKSKKTYISLAPTELHISEEEKMLNTNDNVLRKKLMTFLKDEKLNPLQMKRVDILFNEFIKKKCVTTLRELKLAIHNVEKTQSCDYKTLHRIFKFFISSGVIKHTKKLVEIGKFNKSVDVWHLYLIDENDDLFIQAIDSITANLIEKEKIKSEKDARKIIYAQSKERKELKIKAKEKTMDPTIFIKHNILKRGCSSGTSQTKKRTILKNKKDTKENLPTPISLANESEMEIIGIQKENQQAKKTIKTIELDNELQSNTASKVIKAHINNLKAHKKNRASKFGENHKYKGEHNLLLKKRAKKKKVPTATLR